MSRSLGDSCKAMAYMQLDSSGTSTSYRFDAFSASATRLSIILSGVLLP